MFKDDLLKGKRILVTGGGSGLGKEMTRYFLKYGAEVLICGRRVGVLEDTARELMDENGGSVKCYGLDIKFPAALFTKPCIGASSKISFIVLSTS